MTSHTGRLYSLALGLVAFFLAWAIVAAHPWAKAAPDPRLQALAARQAQLKQQTKLVNRIVALRWARYRTALRARNAQIAAAKSRAASPARASYSAPAAPPVKVVTLPPLTITRTS
jgi:hypothetical protein